MPARVRRRAPVSRRITVFLLAAGSALVFARVGLAGNGGLLPPTPHSPNAHRVNDAFVFVLIFTGIVFLGVEGALVAFAVKYRRGKRPRTQDGPQIHGSSRLEFAWTVLPVLLLVAIGGFIFYKLPGIANAPKASAADSTDITVEGRQFYWMFRYPNGAISIGTMVAPADQVVNERVISNDEDVNHSWWVPNLGGKMDAIPGRTNHTWFQAPEGTYVARCAELCGIQHAKMIAHVDVVPRTQYDAYLQQRQTPGPALGQEEWEHVCSTCHTLDHAFVGPALGGNPLLKDEKGLSTIIHNGVGKMPAVGSDWSEAQVKVLMNYVKTLKGSSNGG
jgi:cytochrome c oxidase subunit 2